MPTFAQILKELELLRHRQTILESISNHLSAFLGDEATPPEDVLQTEGVGPVPASLVEEVLQELKQEYVLPVQESIQAFEDLEIKDVKIEKSTKKGSSRESSSEEASKDQRNGKANAARAGAGGPTKVRLKDGRKAASSHISVAGESKDSC